MRYIYTECKPESKNTILKEMGAKAQRHYSFLFVMVFRTPILVKALSPA